MDGGIDLSRLNSHLLPCNSIISLESRLIYMSTIALCLKKREDLLGEDLQANQTHHSGRFDPRHIKFGRIYVYRVNQKISVIFAHIYLNRTFVAQRAHIYIF